MDYVYFDLSIGDLQCGRVVFELFTKDAPLNSNNFINLCENKSYVNTYFHKIIKNFIIQGGNININSNNDNIASNYPNIDNLAVDNDNDTDEFLEDENLINLDKSFLLCLTNFNKKNHNNSQFFITLNQCPHLNGKHTVIGKVIYGKSILREIEKSNVISNKLNDKLSWIPSIPIIITDCGKWNNLMSLPNKFACIDNIGGDIYEEYPDDNDFDKLNINFENIQQSFEITMQIKESATLLFKNKRLEDSLLKYKKALRYCNELIPDENSNKEMFINFQNLKLTIYLNLSLVSLNLNNYELCINYCGILLQLNDNKDIKLTNIQMAKIFYRLGKSYRLLKKFDIAYETLNKGLIIVPNDISIKNELEIVKKIISKNKETERNNYAKFFS